MFSISIFAQLTILSSISFSYHLLTVITILIIALANYQQVSAASIALNVFEHNDCFTIISLPHCHYQVSTTSYLNTSISFSSTFFFKSSFCQDEWKWGPQGNELKIFVVRFTIQYRSSNRCKMSETYNVVTSHQPPAAPSVCCDEDWLVNYYREGWPSQRCPAVCRLSFAQFLLSSKKWNPRAGLLQGGWEWWWECRDPHDQGPGWVRSRSWRPQ